MTEIMIIGLCLLINGFLSATETAFVCVGRPELRAMGGAGHLRAARLLALREQPERTLAVIQIGITTVGLISGAVGGVGSQDTLGPLLVNQVGLHSSWAGPVSIILVVVPLTYLTVVLGELAPKAFALRYPRRIGLSAALWLPTFERVISPAVTVLEWSTKLVLRVADMGRSTVATQSTVEVEDLTEAQQRYIINLVNIETLTVGDITLPWERVTFAESSQSAEEVLSVVNASGHTRLPVCGSDNEVTGLLHTKEFMAFLVESERGWHSLIRPVLSVADGEPLLKVLRTMQEQRSHLVVVYQQNGARLGIVTLEDIIEEVFGEVYDEDDDQALRRMLSARSRSSSLNAVRRDRKT